MARVSDLPALAIRRPTLIVVANLLIALAGLAALFGVEVRELPDVDRPVVTVRRLFRRRIARNHGRRGYQRARGARSRACRA